MEQQQTDKEKLIKTFQEVGIQFRIDNDGDIEIINDDDPAREKDIMIHNGGILFTITPNGKCTDTHGYDVDCYDD